VRLIYTNFAYIYDRLSYDVNYSKWADYIESIIKRKNGKPSLILDLGCGTGNFCIEMSKRGYDMIGLDISVDMLACAKSKAENEGQNILFLNQDMTDFELYGTVDVIVCLMDSMNYITDKSSIKRLFKLVMNYLNPEGLFVFDINSYYKLEQVLGSNVFYDISNEITYIWQNKFDTKKKISTFDLTFFINDNGMYRRYDEVHSERAYTLSEMQELIGLQGLELLDIYDELNFKKPREKSERIFFVCKK
jgi:SAM-dependent methyltransferase